MKILNVVGARPNFIKIAPIVEQMRETSSLHGVLVHTGQHYGEMSDGFFQDLSIPTPDIHLDVGSGTHAEQTARVMVAFEQVCVEHKPDMVLVVGDVNSTIACAIVAAKLAIPVAHVEAGLRSFDRAMPEEINRIVTDALSSVLFTTCRDANDNLAKEGVDSSKIHMVGNVMIDTLLANRDKAASLSVDKPSRYALVTLHRPSNVDDREVLSGILDALAEIADSVPVLFPIHPRTANRMKEFGISEDKISFIPPLNYLEFLHLEISASVVLTDSGGIQEETAVLGVPCLTLRHNTERPVTISNGTNMLVGPERQKIMAAYAKILRGEWKIGGPPELWDGHAAERLVAVLSSL